MSRILLGTICGLVYGVLSAASMLPLTFTDKRAALLARSSTASPSASSSARRGYPYPPGLRG